MKKMQVIMLAMLMALVPGMASAVLVEALDFTGGGSAWTITVKDAGYPYTLELDGDTTKVGYVQNTTATGGVMMFQKVSAPVGYTMENIRLEALGSGYSSWIMLGRIGLSTVGSGAVPTGTLWTGIDKLPTGVVHTDTDVVIDASGHVSVP